MAIARAHVLLQLAGFIDAVSPIEGGSKAGIEVSKNLTNGTAAQQASDVHRAETTVSGSGTASIDLQALTDVHGNTITAAEIVAFAIIAGDDNAGELQLKPHATDGWTALWSGDTDHTNLEAGAALTLFCPLDGKYAVSASNKVILVTNSEASDMVFQLLVMTRSA